MLSSIRHRGPDGEGIHLGDYYALGHVRLSIIDLATGDQPMLNADGTYQLIANGEIYNYRELRERLSAGFEFRTASDNEVITALYDRDGVEGFAAINGMYAFVLADARRNRIVCAVDPVGIKPLYYLRRDDVVLVASELRAIVAGMRELGVPVELSVEDAHYYLRNGWVSNRRSIVSGVQRLGPGDVIEIDDALKIRLRTGSIGLASSGGIGDRPVTDKQLKDALQSAVDRQMVADVPIGFFLSGGIDSSLLVAMASKIRDDIKTFTVDFQGSHEAAGVSEAQYAREVAKKLGCRHFELRFDASTLLERLDETFACLDEPLADPAVMPLLVISEFAREHVKVCISGDGGDELFSGYTRHQLQPYRTRIADNRLAVAGVRRIASVAIGAAGTRQWLQWLRRAGLGLDMLAERQFVYGPFAGRNGHWLADRPECEDAGAGAGLFASELNGPLPGQMLSKTDRASMNKGLEVRVPFLDRDFIAVAQAYPENLKRSGGTGKIPLRKMLGEMLPAIIAERRKHGFRVPISSWMRSEMRFEVLGRLVDDNAIPEAVLPSASIRSLCEFHLSGAAEHGIRIWALLSLRESIVRLGIR